MILNNKIIASNHVPLAVRNQPFFGAEKTYTIEKDVSPEYPGCRLYLNLTRNGEVLLLDISLKHDPKLEKYLLEEE